MSHSGLALWMCGELSEDGNLILREGKPGDPVRNDPVWESGRAFDKKVKTLGWFM